jgi:hypothetical protein
LAKKKTRTNKIDWLDKLRAAVYRRPLAIFRFGLDEWESVLASRDGRNRFTVTYSHDMLEKVRPPAACLIFTQEQDLSDGCYFARLSARRPVSTLDSWLKIESAQRIGPDIEAELCDLVSDKALATNLQRRLKQTGPVIALSPALSAHLVDKLARVRGNAAAMRRVAAGLEEPRTLSRNGRLQQDAVKMALGAFGIPAHRPARYVEAGGERETALSRIREDAVIEHDARFMPTFTLRDSDLTGRAVFENGAERLEVITANRRPLEMALGVDLIYLNAIKNNIVMVQYKMLEAARRDGRQDWIYRPDAQLTKEIRRMKRFMDARPPGPLEYRINQQVFYLKFVPRDAIEGRSAITMPIDQYEILRTDPDCKGPKGAFRVSYRSLNGRYLRQEPFLELIRAGYIGAHAEKTADLKMLVDAILKDNQALVAAIHSYIPYGS